MTEPRLDDASEFSAFFYGQATRAVQLARFLGADDPEDVAQEAFCKVYAARGRLDERDPAAYLNRAVVNEVRSPPAVGRPENASPRLLPQSPTRRGTTLPRPTDGRCLLPSAGSRRHSGRSSCFGTGSTSRSRNCRRDWLADQAPRSRTLRARSPRCGSIRRT